MKKLFIIIGFLVLSKIVFASQFELTSPNLISGQSMNIDQVYNEYGCNGKNISPELSWNNAPTATKSFAVIMYDPDAAHGWWHWVVFNLPENINHLALNAGNSRSNQLPAAAIQLQNDFGTMGYSGPCPPLGEVHKYIITVYALKTILPFNKNSSVRSINSYIEQNKIAAASIETSYER